MINTFLSRKIVILVAILSGGLLIASGILISANFVSAQSVNVSQVSQWTEPVGLGISAPACSSAVPVTTCVGNKPQATLSWVYGGQHGRCEEGQTDVTVTGPGGESVKRECNGERTLNNLANNTTYPYSISWYTCVPDGDGERCGYGDAITSSFTTPNCPVPPPATPALSATASCSIANIPQVTLSWTATPSAGITNYHIEGCRGVACTAFLQFTTSTTSPLIRTNLATSTTFRYRILSHNHPDAVYSGYSNIVSVTTPASCSLSPDLTAGATIATPPSSAPGQSVSFLASISNIGTAAASNFPNVFQVANSDMTVTMARVNTGTVSSLAAGSSTNISGSYPFASAGTYNVRACANMDTSGNISILESNVGNNCGSWVSIIVSPPGTFNYSLSNSGNSNVTKTSGNAFTTNTITKTLLTGPTESVTLTPSGMPAGVSVSVANQGCSPRCTSVITFTVPPSTPVGTYPITVTGSPLNKQTRFNLVVSGNPLNVSCSSFPRTALVGELVTWTASVSGGTPPLSYSWSGTNIPTSPAPSTNPFSIRYSTIGSKTATVTVTDTNSVRATCPSTIQINFNPLFEEF